MLSNKMLLVIVSLVTMTCLGLGGVWFVKSEIEAKKLVETTKSFYEEEIYQAVSPDIEDNSIDAEENIVSSIIQISTKSNIVGISAYKNRNAILYLEKTKSNYKLFGADLTKDSTIETPHLLDSGSLRNAQKGLWGLSSGLTFDCSIYFSDVDSKESLVLQNFTSDQKEFITIDSPYYTSNIILGGLDDTIIYARNNNTTSEVEVVSKKISGESVEILLSRKYPVIENGSYLKWIDISSDYTKFLYCLEDNSTKKNILWYHDLTNDVPIKLTNDDENILSAKFSKDGSKIIYASSDSVGFSNILFYDLVSQSSTKLTTGNNKYISPDWLYYDNTAIFLSDIEGSQSLNILKIDYKE